MLNIDKKKAFTLFTLSSLIMVSLLAGAYIPASAQPDDLMYLHGPSLEPIHMHSNIALNPIHMHNLNGILWPGEPPITEPNCTTDWQWIAPDVNPPFEKWHLSSWEDLGEPFGELSPNDQIDMNNTDTLEVEWFHVDRMTLTLNLSGPFPFPYHEPGPTHMLLELKWPYYDPYVIYQPDGTVWHEVWPINAKNIYQISNWLDDPFFPDGVLSFTDAISFDGGANWWHVEDVATDLILRWKMMDPIGTGWHELYPDYCNQYEITSWDSFPDPYCDRISNKDLIDMWDFNSSKTRWYFVDRVTITINVYNNQTQESMMLELKTEYFEEMYYYIKHPVGSLWHAVYPEDVYCTVWELSWWDLMDPLWDNCNGVLDPCDYILLINPESGLDERWHIEHMAYDIILNEYITDPEGTSWNELYPDCSLIEYDIINFEDNGDLWLSPCDNITLADPSGLAEDYHVENVTLTLNITVLDTIGLPFTIDETLYLEHMEGIEEPWNYTWPRLYHPKIEPLDTNWFIVCPSQYFGLPLTIINWYDNCNGVIDYCDTLEFLGPAGELLIAHVEEIAVDINVKKLAPTLVHDVAVIDVFSIYDWVYQGDIDPINVTVTNEGDYTESVAVDAFVNGGYAAPTQNIVLNPGETQTLTFNWDTTGYPLGFYQTSGQAVIAIDNDPNDNFMNGNLEEVKLRPPWYKKPPYPDYAPFGMPDFDQKQWLDQTYGFTYCGPVAVANSLWWFDSQYEPNTIGPPAIIDNFPMVTAYGAWDDHDPQNVIPFVNNLAFLMDTDGQRTGLVHAGTNYIDMQTGISQYLQQQGINPIGDCDGDGDVDAADIAIINVAFGSTPFAGPWDMRADIIINNAVDANDLIAATANIGQMGMFYEHTEDFPDFYFIEEEVERCQDVVLLLTFWQELQPGEWIPVEYPFDLPSGGHYVTVAGVNSTTGELLLSDPWYDAAESGLPGDVPNPHALHPAGPTVHNDAQFVSHDAYGVAPWPSPPPTSPYPFTPLVWELVGYLQPIFPPNFHTFIRAAVITSPLAGHDVAVTNITTSKTGCIPMETVGNGTTCNVTVTFENQGGFTETFNATVKAGATVIGAQVVVLNAGQNITITFVWDTTSFAHGDYLISAEASVVPGETDTADNTMNYGTVRVTWKGDVDGDGDVDIFDIVRMATIYGVVKPNPSYDPNCDIDNDGDIDIFDIVAAATNYGKGT